MNEKLLAGNKTKCVRQFNCGGFALGSADWYIPIQWRDDECNIEKTLNDCTEDILHDFPELTRVRKPEAVPKETDVIGFRVSFYTKDFWEGDEPEDIYILDDSHFIVRYTLDDFHFIVRTRGEWYHKPGSKDIVPFQGNVHKRWIDDGRRYTSRIVWFARKQKLEDIITKVWA